MAEVMEKEYATNSKANAALTTGIIGTSLAGLLTLGKGGLGNLFGWGCNNGSAAGAIADVTNEDLYVERKECQDYIDLTKQYYNGQLATQRELADQFFASYKQNVESSQSLYQKIIDSSFGLYKNQRDIKDDLIAKIDSVDKKVDMMAAVRPYQDALINAKIDNNALLADFNLARRTCHMIQGQLVLPSTPVVSGYGSYCCSAVASSTSGATA